VVDGHFVTKLRYSPPVGTVVETTAGQGARPVGFSAGTDDWACVLLAIKESQTFTKAGYGAEHA
jgi:hypothetical protein